MIRRDLCLRSWHGNGLELTRPSGYGDNATICLNLYHQVGTAQREFVYSSGCRIVIAGYFYCLYIISKGSLSFSLEYRFVPSTWD